MASKMRIIREYFSLTQAEMAEKLGVSRNYIAKIEAGKYELSPRIIDGLHKTFQISEDWLMYGKGEMIPGIKIAPKNMTKGERLKTIRKHFSITRKELAQILNTNYNYILGIENGRYKLSDKKSDILCIHYPISRKWLDSGIGPMIEPGPNKKEVRKIFDAIMSMEDEQLDIIIKKLNEHVGKKKSCESNDIRQQNENK